MSWEPDAHADAYVWTAALGGHLAIGVALWIAAHWFGPWWAVVAASAAYSLWEIASAWRWGLLLMDSLLDTVGVTFGALTAAGLWVQSWPLAAICCACACIIAYAGHEKRRR